LFDTKGKSTQLKCSPDKDAVKQMPDMVSLEIMSSCENELFGQMKVGIEYHRL